MGTDNRIVSLAVMLSIEHYFSYNKGIFVQDLQKKKFALASRPTEENSKIQQCPFVLPNYQIDRQGTSTRTEKGEKHP